MKKYRIRKHTRIDGSVFYWVEKRFFLIFWSMEDCYMSLDKAHKAVETAKFAGWEVV